MCNLIITLPMNILHYEYCKQKRTRPKPKKKKKPDGYISSAWDGGDSRRVRSVLEEEPPSIPGMTLLN